MKPATVVIAGSRALPQGQAPRLLIRFLAGLPEGSTILLRRGIFTQPGLFEHQVEEIVDLIGLRLEWRYPDPGGRGKDGGVAGRRLTWARDVEMIDEADLVLTFVLDEQVGDETSGTFALVEKAIQLNKPVYSYSLLTYGPEGPVIVQRVGEHDPGNVWSELVPSV